MSLLDGILTQWSRTNWNGNASAVATAFNADCSVTETASFYEKRTEFNADGSILESYFIRGAPKLTVLIEFANGSITETVQ